MKTTILSAAAALLMATGAMADPIEGTWRTSRDDNGNSGLITVTSCAGDAYCGTLTTAYDASGNTMSTENVGRMILIEMRPRGGGEYRGQVYSPDRGQTYNSRAQLSGNSLSIRGCILGICRDGGTWTRQ